MIPLGLGGVNGILETTVIQGDVPLLLPIRLLRALDVILEKQKLQMFLQRHQFVLDLHEMPSGHVTVGIFDFAKGDFRVPSEAGAKSEFVLGDGEHPEAMPAQALPGQFEHQAKSTTVLTMAALLKQATKLVGTNPTEEPPPMYEEASVALNPRRAWRNWSIMDKVVLILALAAFQTTADEWAWSWTRIVSHLRAWSRRSWRTTTAW